MKKFILISLFSLSISGMNAQERFFNYVEGWVNNYSLQYESSYMFLGLGDLGINAYTHNHTLNELNFQGETINTFLFELDSSESTSSRLSSQMSFLKGEHTIVSVGVIGIDLLEPHYAGSIIEIDLLSNSFTLLNDLSLYDDIQLSNIVQSNDSTYLIFGRYSDGNTIRTMFYNTDTDGSIRWQTDYYCGFWCDTYPQYILPLSNGNTAILLREFDDDFPNGEEPERAVLVLLDDEGNELWRRYPGDDEGHRIWPGALLEVNNEILVSYTDPYYFDEFDQAQYSDSNTVHLNRYDFNGQLIDSISYLNEIINSLDSARTIYRVTQMQHVSDGNILISGTTDPGAMLLKIDLQGELIWFREHLKHPLPPDGGFPADLFLYHVSPTTDGGFICAGQFYSTPSEFYPQGIQTAIALKVDQYGCLEPGCEYVSIPEWEIQDATFEVYPNPYTAGSSAPLGVRFPQEVQLEQVMMVDALGRMINLSLESLRFEVSAPSETNIKLQTTQLQTLPHGLYTLIITTKDGSVYSRKVVVE